MLKSLKAFEAFPTVIFLCCCWCSLVAVGKSTVDDDEVQLLQLRAAQPNPVSLMMQGQDALNQDDHHLDDGDEDEEDDCFPLANVCGFAKENFTKDAFLGCCNQSQYCLDTDNGSVCVKSHTPAACSESADELFVNGVEDCRGSGDLLQYHVDHMQRASNVVGASSPDALMQLERALKYKMKDFGALGEKQVYTRRRRAPAINTVFGRNQQYANMCRHFETSAKECARFWLENENCIDIVCTDPSIIEDKCKLAVMSHLPRFFKSSWSVKSQKCKKEAYKMRDKICADYALDMSSGRMKECKDLYLEHEVILSEEYGPGLCLNSYGRDAALFCESYKAEVKLSREFHDCYPFVQGDGLGPFLIQDLETTTMSKGCVQGKSCR